MAISPVRDGECEVSTTLRLLHCSWSGLVVQSKNIKNPFVTADLVVCWGLLLFDVVDNLVCFRCEVVYVNLVPVENR